MTDSPDNLILKVEQLTKWVESPEGRLDILRDVNLTIMAGQTLAVLGASGAGKSTLLGILAGLDVPSSGKVWLKSHDFFQLNEDGRARLRGELMGFVFQSFQLLPSLTALENVMLPLELSGHRDAREAAMATLQRVGLQPRALHYPRQLSGGEQQRVAIARAFAGRPAILLADEPTGNLDGHTGERVIDLLFELNREQHTTLVLVTHDLDLAQRCQRRARLADGSLHEEA
ncbi:MAG: ABC transporter ATP-binding protein [Gammaproteobacteria bacterium]|nr:ABC transporter ATP-binding protein [Gammaproteobacteria bacterium]